jgi:hypothetical protein
MCGIVGLISRKSGGFYHKDMEIFKELLLIDMIRGDDSTGAYAISKWGGADIVKIGSNPLHLFATKEWSTFQSNTLQNGQIVVGHNRKATRGAVNSNNAHPFHEGRYVLVHNGTLQNHAKWKTGKDVDSHALCQAFNEYGHEAVIPEIEGAFALAFYNLETEKFYLIRNSERPLGVVYSKDMLAFASEAWMPQILIRRAGEEVKEVEQLVPGELWEFGIKDGFDVKAMKLHHKVHSSPNWSASEWNAVNENFYDNMSNARQSGGGQSASSFRGTNVSQNTGGDNASSIHRIAGLPSGTEVQFIAHRCSNEKHPTDGQERFKLIGHIQQIGKPNVDAVGWLAKDVRAAEIADFLHNPLTARIDWWIASACGSSAWVRDIEIDDDVYAWNAKKIGAYTWKKIVDNEKCGCGSRFHPLEANFTQVKLDGTDTKFTCSKCIGDKLNAPAKEAFFQRRNAAVQSGKSISEAAGQPLVGIFETEAAPTVH